ncbi:DedA family protein [Solibacillus sp. A46]|uniref:DedA family protein n=1 Tax=Solibacillus faecavium TaxID=2762221 RepID=A0ABR8XVG0_9BACL|nr:DedA family protein [Solibacillus faecavium]MBD8035915.1 DedA family protein [Solibacillus faecavium]
MEVLNQLVSQYGYLAIFVILSLGLFGLPIPDELLVLWIGYFTKIGTLNYTYSLVVCIIGTFLGMMFSYYVGKKAGRPLIEHIGRWIGLTDKRIGKTEKWIHKYGPSSIVISFFIPGIRHVTGYFFGVSQMRLKTYAIYVGISAIIWCCVLLTLGRMVGHFD